MHRTLTFFTRHAHLDDIFKMAENMNSDEIIDEVLSASTSFFHWNLFFYFISNNNCRLLTINIVSFIFFIIGNPSRQFVYISSITCAPCKTSSDWIRVLVAVTNEILKRESSKCILDLQSFSRIKQTVQLIQWQNISLVS
jgi:hypothetical protein